MKVLGLISGGKDSIFNLMHCVAHGHTIIGLAHLRSPSIQLSDSISSKTEDSSTATVLDDSIGHEIDSYMYQSVGTNVVHLIAECMELPLFIKTLQGSSVHTKLVYSDFQFTNSSTIPEDEVEDLFLLIQNIKQNHLKDLEAISVGAIFSNYQRLRVESVARRLDLKVLSFLWHQDQSTLLQSMIDCHIEAIIIKTATIGLNSKHLGQSIKSLYSYLLSLKEKWGINVAGEGGEYESLVLDCPLFKKKKIVIEETAIKTHTAGFDTSAFYLKINKACLMDKDSNQNAKSFDWINKIKETSYSYGTVLKLSASDFVNIKLAPHELSIKSSNLVHDCDHTWDIQVSTQDGPFGKCFLMEAPLLPLLKRKDLCLPDQTKYLLDALSLKMDFYDYSWNSIVFVQIQVSDISSFEIINQIYAKYVISHWPPSRVTIQVPTSEKNVHGISIFVYGWEPPVNSSDCDHTLDRLYVSGISYWAPANIGPYSQATRIAPCSKFPGVLFLSGNIGLIPEEMILPRVDKENTNEAFDLQWNYLWRNQKAILDEVKSDLSKTLIHIGFVTNHLDSVKVKCYLNETIKTLRIDGINDVNEKKLYLRKADLSSDSCSMRRRDNLKDKECLQSLIVLVVVPQLPRQALIEWQLIQHVPMSDISDDSSLFRDNASDIQISSIDSIRYNSFLISERILKRHKFDSFVHVHCVVDRVNEMLVTDSIEESEVVSSSEFFFSERKFGESMSRSLHGIQLFLRMEVTYSKFASKLKCLLSLSENFPINYTPILADDEGTLYHVIMHYL